MFNIKRYVPLAILFSRCYFSRDYLSNCLKTTKSQKDIIVRSENNTEQIGNVLYTDYFIDFQLSGIVLLLAMIGAIVLTHVYRPTIKRQNIE
jgi:NADH-quinone oxidoreductase subunit J